MITVFLDTVGLIALWNKSDQWHTAATAAFGKLSPTNTRLVTTEYVLLECANDAARRAYRTDIVRLRQELYRAGGVLEVTAEDVEYAWDQYSRGVIGSAGVIDQISITLMRRMRILQVFSNDKHFASAGFEVLF